MCESVSLNESEIVRPNIFSREPSVERFDVPVLLRSIVGYEFMVNA